MTTTDKEKTVIRAGLVWTGLNGCVAVAAGAYAAHGVADARAADWIRTGSAYQLWHALALLGVLLWMGRRPGWPDRLIATAGGCFALGSLLFSGALYIRATLGPGPLAALAPAGGTLLMVGWLAVAASAVFPARD